MVWTIKQRTRSPRLRRPDPAPLARRRSGSGSLLRLAVIAAIPPLCWWAIAWFQQLPRVEPPFERLVGPGAGPIKELNLPDTSGRIHTTAEWAGKSAVVLAFLVPDGPEFRDLEAEWNPLVGRFASNGVTFLGVDPTPAIDSNGLAHRWSDRSLPFPILLDARQRVARQAGIASTPTAVVVLPDGQVVYRGPVHLQSKGLEKALSALANGVLPTIAEEPRRGQPIPPMETSPGLDEPITFNKHVAPILWNNCARCHRPGEVGPFSLLTYRDAAKRASFLREVIESGQMPPWKAHPGAGVFLDAARLSVLEKETLAQWVASGCAEGDPADLPPRPDFPEGWALGPPDLILTMPRPWEQHPGKFDTYRAFALPMPADRDLAITAVEFHPGNRKIVHHSRLHVDETGDARRREESDPAPGFAGWRGRNIMELPYPGIGGWTPGLTPRHSPEGSGRVIRRGSDIVLQVHYHPSGKVETDQSRVGLYFARGPLSRPMAGLSISTDRINIPAGAKRQPLIQAARVKADIRLYTVVPHAHYLCREFRLSATLPDGTVQPLLWITDWDFDWQDQYRFARPVRLPKDTILTFAAYFDNSEANPRNPNHPPRTVRYGIQSQDEMCACHLEFLPEESSGYAEYPNKSPFGM